MAPADRRRGPDVPPEAPDPKHPRPFLFGSSALATIDVNVNAPSLDGVPVSLGRIGLFVDKGAAFLNGDGRTVLIWNKSARTQDGVNRTRVGLSNGDGTFTFLDPQDYPPDA